MEIEIRGGESFTRAAYRLRQQTEARTEAAYRRAIVSAAKPLGQKVTEGVPRYLPEDGGYAGVLAGALRLTTSVTQRGVTIKAKAPGRKGHPRRIDRLERGELQAPSWPGRRARKRWEWHTQYVKPHFFTDPIRKSKDAIADRIIHAMREIADKIAG